MAFFVNVPNVPGVPLVNFAAGAGNIIALLIEDALSLFAGAFMAQQWGIYLGGAPIVTADNVVSFDFKKSASIADFPIEGGLFESYNKVQIPFDARFRYSAGGSESNRQALLDSIDPLVGDTNIYDVVTPTAVYLNVNIVNYDYGRSAMSGAGLLQVDVWAIQVRVAPSAAMSSTKDPVSAAQSNGGTVQPTAPTATQAAFAQTIAPGF